MYQKCITILKYFGVIEKKFHIKFKSEGDKLIRIYTYDNFTSQNNILNHFMKYLNNVYYLNYKMYVNFS